MVKLYGVFMNTSQPNQILNDLKERLLAIASTVVVQSDMMPQA